MPAAAAFIGSALFLLIFALLALLEIARLQRLAVARAGARPNRIAGAEPAILRARPIVELVPSVPMRALSARPRLPSARAHLLAAVDVDVRLDVVTGTPPPERPAPTTPADPRLSSARDLLLDGAC